MSESPWAIRTLKPQFASCMIYTQCFTYMAVQWDNARSSYYIEWNYFDLNTNTWCAGLYIYAYTAWDLYSAEFSIQQLGLQAHKPWFVWATVCLIIPPESALPYSSKSGVLPFQQEGNLTVLKSPMTWETLLLHSASPLTPLISSHTANNPSHLADDSSHRAAYYKKTHTEEHRIQRQRRRNTAKAKTVSADLISYHNGCWQ